MLRVLCLSKLLMRLGYRRQTQQPTTHKGDGLVERCNHSLLQLFHTYIDEEFDWEQHLRTSFPVHLPDSSSLLYKRIPTHADVWQGALLFDSLLTFDPGSYQHYL